MFYKHLTVIMIAAILISPGEMLVTIAKKARAKRLAQNFSQQTLAERSGVSLSVLKQFEQSGKISLSSLLKLGLTLDALGDFEALFKPKDPLQMASLDELININARKRGRK